MPGYSVQELQSEVHRRLVLTVVIACCEKASADATSGFRCISMQVSYGLLPACWSLKIISRDVSQGISRDYAASLPVNVYGVEDGTAMFDSLSHMPNHAACFFESCTARQLRYSYLPHSSYNVHDAR